MSLNSAAFSNLVDLTHVVIYDGFGFYEGGSKFKVRPIDDVTDVPRGTRLRSPDSRARKSHFASHSSGHCGNSQVALYSRVEEGNDFCVKSLTYAMTILTRGIFYRST